MLVHRLEISFRWHFVFKFDVMLKSDHGLPRYGTYALRLAGTWIWPKKGVKGVVNFEPYDFRDFDPLGCNIHP